MTTSVPYVKALPNVSNSKPAIGHLLLEAGKLTAADIERVLLLQKSRPMRFGEAALTLGVLRPADLQQALALQFDYCYLSPGEGGLSPELLAAYRPFGEEMEAIRGLRGRLARTWFGDRRQELTIAGVDSGDGASVLAANLAISFAQQGERTLLIDANLRRPRQQSLFNVRSRQGLTDMLADRAGPEAICKLDVIPLLSVLSAGTPAPNPQELLNRRSFNSLRVAMRAHYDVILYDAPAFSLADDAFAVSADTSGVLVVARQHRAVLAKVRSLGEQLNAERIAVAGSVLNEF